MPRCHVGCLIVVWRCLADSGITGVRCMPGCFTVFIFRRYFTDMMKQCCGSRLDVMIYCTFDALNNPLQSAAVSLLKFYDKI
jgi:hypothetical protein